jgi:hypothetical protein
MKNEGNQIRHDFKEIDAGNWQTVDQQTARWMQMTGVIKTQEEWVDYYLRAQLKPSIPREIVTLLEVARGDMIYGWFFYPLLTLGAEQCWRVLESGVRFRCRQVGIQTERIARSGRKDYASFSENTNALLERNLAGKFDKSCWDSVRNLRNSTSHPDQQFIMDPAQARRVVEITVHSLNDLFP